MSQKKQAGQVSKLEAKEATKLLKLGFSKFLNCLPSEDKKKLALDLVEILNKAGV